MANPVRVISAATVCKAGFVAVGEREVAAARGQARSPVPGRCRWRRRSRLRRLLGSRSWVSAPDRGRNSPLSGFAAPGARPGMTEQEAIHFPSLRDGPKDQTRKSRDSQMCKLHIVVRCFASPRNDRTRLLRRGARHRARFRATRWPPCANASRLSQAMTAGTSPPKNQKAGSRPAALLKYFSPLGARAERGSTRALKVTSSSTSWPSSPSSPSSLS